MDLSPGKRKLLERILEHRELPPEVLEALELFLSGELELDDKQYPELTKALLRAEDDGEGEHKVGGIIFR